MPYFEMRLLAAPEVLKPGIKRLFIGKEPFQNGLLVSRLLMAKENTHRMVNRIAVSNLLEQLNPVVLIPEARECHTKHTITNATVRKKQDIVVPAREFLIGPYTPYNTFSSMHYRVP